ncbi:MAG TPA: MFS transporter, partial [Egibacteraceae bacterium]|nr:MFS transporter [Egibacteraceae bacterium]
MPSARRVALVLGLLVALTVVGSSAVAVALPDVAGTLSLDTAGTAWVLACFSLSFSITTAFFGRVADLYGLRVPLRVGVVLFAGGSLLAGGAWSFPAIVVGRLVQGAGAGAVPVLALGIIAARFRGPARSQALGALTAVVTVVSGAGPLIGGGITEMLSWRAVLALPALALLVGEPAARLAPAGPPEGGSGRSPGGLDVRGALLVAMTVAATTLLLQSPATGLGPAAAGVFGAGAALGAAGIVRHLGRRPLGFLPAVVVRDGAFRRCAFSGLALLAAYVGMLLALPLLLAANEGWRPFQIGLALLPAAGLGAVVASTVGAWVDRLGPYRMATGVTAGSALGLLVAAAAPESPVLLVVGMCLVVTGFAGGQVALLDAVSSLVDDAHRGVVHQRGHRIEQRDLTAGEPRDDEAHAHHEQHGAL